MLQIRLNNRASSEGGGGAKALPVETVTVACPDHLILADLPVAKSIGNASTTSHTKTIGRRSRRHLGERVHFCVRCDFPIAIYGRLSPCEHAFCLDCARSDSSCYLCDERIQKIQTIKMMEGIFICAAPHCLKSFLKKSDFESHIHESHADLLQPNTDKEDVNELDAFNATRGSSTDLHSKQSVPMEISTARSLPRAGFSPSSNVQAHDSEDRARRQQPREQPPLKPLMQPKPPPYFGRHQNPPSEMHPENNPPQGFDRPGPYNRFHPQQGFDMQGGPVYRRDPEQFPDKQQGIISESPFPDYPMHSQQPPTFVVPVNANQGMPPTFSYPPFPAAEGAQPFFNAHYETARTDLASEGGSEQGSLLGFPPHPPGSMSFPDNYPRPWNVGHAGAPFEQMPVSQGVSEGYTNAVDSQGRVQFFQGDYGRMSGGLPSNPPPLLPPMGSKGLESHQSGTASDHKDGKGVLAPLPLPPPPPPPLPHLSQLQRGSFSNSGDTGECIELTSATRDKVSQLQGDLGKFLLDVDSVRHAVQTLEQKFGKIEKNQDITTSGVCMLVDFVLENGDTRESIQESPSTSSRPALEAPLTPASRCVSLPPQIIELETASPSLSTKSPKVSPRLRWTTTTTSLSSGLKVSPRLRGTTSLASGLKDVIQVTSSTDEAISSSEISPVGTRTVEDPKNSGSSSSSRFGWRLPGLGAPLQVPTQVLGGLVGKSKRQWLFKL